MTTPRAPGGRPSSPSSVAPPARTANGSVCAMAGLLRSPPRVFLSLIAPGGRVLGVMAGALLLPAADDAPPLERPGPGRQHRPLPPLAARLAVDDHPVAR